MSNAVDNRVVQLEMENGSFEKNANKSIKTLDKLDTALNLKNGKRSFEEVEQAAAKCNFKPLLSAADTVVAKFSAMEIAGIAALTNLTNKAVNSGIRMAKSLSIDQITSGYSKYEQKTSNVQTLVNSTGKSIQEVNKYLDRLMWFSDETSYGFTDMTQALSTMVSSGGDIDKLVPMIEGMANATAFAGKGAAEFNRVIYNLNQSYSQGFLGYMDWKSVQMAGASSKQLVETLIRAGEEAGTIKKGQVTVDNFTESLSKKWATREVMENGFGYFDEMTQKAYEMIGTLDDQGNTIDTASRAYEILSKDYDGVSINAAKAAQEAKSFTEAIDSTKDAVSSGWMKTFEIIFGDYGQAKALWTDVSEGLWDIFAGGFEDRNNMLEDVFQTSPVKNYAQSLEDAGVKFDEFKSKLKETYRERGKGMSDRDFETLTAEATTFEELLGQSWVKSDLLEKTISKLPKDMAKTGAATKKTTGNIADLLKDVNSGKYGYGLKNQQKALSEAGIDGSEALGDNWLQKLYNANANGNQEVIDSLNQTLFATEEVTEAATDQVDVWEDLAKKAKEFDNDGYYSKSTGRTIMLDGLKNILGAVGDRLDVVKEAWEKVFPPMTAERLRNIIISFHAFTNSLKMGSGEAAALATVSERVFSVLGKVRDVVVSIGKVGMAAFKLAGRFGQWFVKLEPVAKIISQVKELLDGLHSDTLSGFDSVIQKITKFAETLNSLDSKDFDKFLNKIDPLIKKFKKLQEASAPVISKIGSFFKEVGGWIYDNAITPLGAFISKVIESEDPIGTLVAGIEAFGKKAAAAFKSLWQKIKDGDLKSIFAWFQRTFPSIGSIIDKVSEAFQKLTTNADGTKKSLDFSKVISLITFAGLIAALASIGKALESVRQAADTIKTTFANLNKIFVSKFGNTFASNVRTIALACVALASSLWLIASIPSDRLIAAAVALGVLMIILGALAAAMTFISAKLSKKQLKTITGLVKPMLALSASILILSFALKNIAAALDGTKTAKEGFARVGEMLLLIGGLGLEIIGLTALMALLPGKVKLMSVVMFIVAAALLKVTSALNMIKDLKLSEDAAQVLAGVGVLVFLIALVNAIAEVSSSKIPQVKGFSKLTNVLVGLAAVIAGIYLATLTISKLKGLTLSDITSKCKEAITILGVIAAVGVALGIAGKFVKPAVSAAKDLGIGILAIVASLYLVTLLVERLAGIGDSGMIDSAATAMVWLVGVMAALTVALGYASKLSDGGKGVFKIAASLLVVVVGLTLMVGLLKVIDALFGQMELKHIAKIAGILTGLVVLMGLLAVAVGFAGKLGAGKGTGALIAAVVGVVALAAVLVVLTNFTWDQLAPGIASIAIVMVALGLMMYAIGRAVEAATSNSGAGGAVALIGAAIILGTVAVALFALCDKPWQELGAAFLAIGLTLAAVVGCFAILSKIEFSWSTVGNLLAAIVMLGAVVAAVKLLVPAFQALAELPTMDFLKNMGILLGGVTLLLVVVGVLAVVLGALGVAVPALLAIAGVLVAVGLLCVMFAASMAILANVNYTAIASGLAICIGPMYALSGAGMIMIIGAVGVALMAGAIALFGLACQSAAGGIAAFSIALEYLLGIFSALASGFQNTGSIIGALANFDKEFEEKSSNIEANADKLQKALAKVTGSNVVDMSGVTQDIGNGFGKAGDAIESQAGTIENSMTGVIKQTGNSAASEAATQGAQAGKNWLKGYQDTVWKRENSGITLDPNANPTANLQKGTAPYAQPKAQFDPSLMSPEAKKAYEVQGTEIVAAVNDGVTAGIENSDTTSDALQTMLGGIDVSGVPDVLMTKLSEVLPGVDMSSITSMFTGNFMDGLENSDMGAQLQTWLSGAIDGADFGSIGGEGATNFTQLFGEKLDSFMPTATEKGTEIGNSAKSGLDSVDTTSSGVNFAQGFINGILSLIEQTKAAASSLGAAGTEGLSAGIKEGSPSKITRQSGKYFSEGFIIGINMNAIYAAAAAYNMGVDTVGALDEGIQNGEVNRIVPVLDTSDIYNQMSDFDGTYRPVIKPTLDMSGVDPAFRNMTAVATVRSQNSGTAGTSSSEKTVTQSSVNFTQNNYSPKALPRAEIYRQTRNQLNTMKGMLKRT